MARISAEALEEVKRAFREYEEQVESTNLSPNSKRTYTNRAECFVRWLDGDFEPGSRTG